VTLDVRSLFVEKRRALSFHNNPTAITYVILIGPSFCATVPLDPINPLL